MSIHKETWSSEGGKKGGREVQRMSIVRKGATVNIKSGREGKKILGWENLHLGVCSQPFRGEKGRGIHGAQGVGFRSGCGMV